MSKLIVVFYDKSTGAPLSDTDDWYFVMNSNVYRNNGETRESQSAVVGFEDFTVECPDIGWRVEVVG